MEQITIGQIGVAITVLVGLIGSISFLHSKLKTWVSDALKDQLETIDRRFNEMEKEIAILDIETCKDFLFRFLADVEQGAEVSEIEIERFYKQYQHYIKIGGNSYIRHKYEKLKAEGKL